MTLLLNGFQLAAPGADKLLLLSYEVFNDKSLQLLQQHTGHEKEIKGGSRKKKIDLANNFNPEWKDLYE